MKCALSALAAALGDARGGVSVATWDNGLHCDLPASAPADAARGNSAVDYAPIGPAWMETVAQFSRRLGERWSIEPTSLEPFAAAAVEFTTRFCGREGFVLTDLRGAVVAMLAAIHPYVPVISEADAVAADRDTAESRVLALALRDAPAVIALDAEAARVLEALAVHRLFVFSEPPGVEAAAALRTAVLEGRQQRPAGFDSLRQKRHELVYEAVSVDVYEAKYHDGLGYQRMDQRLVDIVAGCVRDAGIARPRVLDLGCGPGSLAEKLLRIPGIELTGVDLVPEMIEAARERFPGVRFLVGDAESIAFPDGTFDIVLCSGMLHHLPALDIALQEIRRVLRPGGRLVAREPSEDNFAARHPELGYAHLCLRHYLFHAQRLAPIVEPEAHDYHRNFTLQGVCDELGRHLLVDAFHTDLQVTYFYDEVLPGDEQSGWLLPLDDTLSGQPGLNVVVVARKDQQRGISDTVRSKLDALRSPAAVSPDHFWALRDFAEYVFQKYPAEFYTRLSAARPRIGTPAETVLDEIRVLLGDARHVLVVCDDRALLGAVARQLPAALPQVSVVRDVAQAPSAAAAPRVVLAEVGEIAAAAWKAYDAGLIRIDGAAPAPLLARWLECVRDYGVAAIHLREAPPAAALSAGDRAAFASMAVLATQESGSGLSAYLSRWLHSPADFWQAVEVAAAAECRGAEPAHQAALQDFIQSLKYAERVDQSPFSHLVKMANGEHLLGLIERTAWKRTA